MAKDGSPASWAQYKCQEEMVNIGGMLILLFHGKGTVGRGGILIEIWRTQTR